MTEHTIKAFGEELKQLSSDIARMGGLAESLVSDALASVARRDSALAKATIARDAQIDAMHKDLERRIIRLLALRQPMARDLREAIAGIKLAIDIERIGDLGKNIAKRALILHQSDPIPLTRSVERLGRIVCTSLKEVLDAYASAETGRAVAVWRQDDEIDEHYSALFRELLTYMFEDPRTITPSAHMLFIAKNLERIGDHCTNMAETVHYLVTGEELPAERPKADLLAPQ